MPHELRRFQDDGIAMSYEVFGRGVRTVVYLHGILLDSAINHRLAEDLTAAGYRVVLLDLPGHGRSDKPHAIALHRMDAYARRVVGLLDELGIQQAVVGGVSLGADVALQLALAAPERLQGMILEMPVLEQAVPAALVIFAPVLFAASYAASVMRPLLRLARRLPRERLGVVGNVMGVAELDPEDIAAVLKGVAVGPIAPTVHQRGSMNVPALVIGHRADRLHPFGDAARLATQLPDARFIEARSILELRLRPARLTTEILSFLDRVFQDGHSWEALSAGERSG